VREPALAIENIVWIQRESLVEELACARGFARELVEVRPGRLGVYVVLV
jgi:hypothetical protein